MIKKHHFSQLIKNMGFIAKIWLGVYSHWSRRAEWLMWGKVWVEYLPFTLWLQDLSWYPYLSFLKHCGICNNTNTGPHNFLISMVSCVKRPVTGSMILPRFILFTLTTTLWSWCMCKTSRQHVNRSHPPGPLPWLQTSHWVCPFMGRKAVFVILGHRAKRLEKFTFSTEQSVVNNPLYLSRAWEHDIQVTHANCFIVCRLQGILKEYHSTRIGFDQLQPGSSV